MRKFGKLRGVYDPTYRAVKSNICTTCEGRGWLTPNEWCVTCGAWGTIGMLLIPQLVVIPWSKPNWISTIGKMPLEIYGSIDAMRPRMKLKGVAP